MLHINLIDPPKTPRLALLCVLLLAFVAPVAAQQSVANSCEAPTSFNPLRALEIVSEAQDFELEGDNQAAVAAYTQALKLGAIPRWTVYQARAQNRRWLGEFENALTDINCAISIAPWNLMLHRDLGSLYFILGEHKDAEAELRLVLEALPDDAETNFFLGLILVQAEQYEEAVERLTSAEDAYQSNAYFYSRRAWAHYYTGRYEAAIDDSSRALKLGLSFDVDEVYEVRARALDAAQDYENAAEEWTHVIELNPDYDQWYLSRGRSYLSAEQYDEAIADFTYVLEHRDQTYGYFWRGFAYIGQKSYDLALADFDRIDKLDPNAIEGYYGRAQMFLAMRQRDRVIAELTAGIEAHPDSTALYSFRAGYYLQERQFEAAMSDYDTVLELETPTAARYYARATAYLTWRRYELAIEDLDEAIALTPEYAEAYALRAVANFSLENYDDAEADMDRALELSKDGPNLGSWRYFYFSYLRQDYEQSIALYNELIEWLPRAPSGYISRAGAYLLMEDFESALADASRAVELRPDELNPHFAEAYIYLEMGDTDRALKKANWLIEHFPDESLSYLARAMTYQSLGQETEMFADLAMTRQLQISPNGEVELIIGKYYQSIGNHALAAYFFEEARQKAFLPSAESYILLAEAYEGLGRYDDALTLYERYLRMTAPNANPDVAERVAQLQSGQFELADTAE